MTNNYFKVARQVFFFDSTRSDTVTAAFEAAVKMRLKVPHSHISIFRRIDLTGPWHYLPEVGEAVFEGDLEA